MTLLASLLGCQAARVERPLVAELGGNDEDAQLEFWHELANRSVTSNDDAFHGLLLFLDGTDPGGDYAGRVETLKSRGMLPRGFNEPPDAAVQRGTLAVALVKALSIRGGLTMSLLGPSPRYATRELQFANVYPTSSPNQTFSGSEFLGIIGKAEDYQSGRSGATPPTDAAQPPPIQREQTDIAPPSGEPAPQDEGRQE